MTNYLQKSKDKSKNILLIFSIVILFLFVTPSFQSEATFYNSAYVLKAWTDVYQVQEGFFLASRDQVYTTVYYNTAYRYDTATTILSQNSQSIYYRRVRTFESY